ncbi:hypothetical protein BGW80DRAFT_1289437 [Lactifluus volemus]|nr:hypothetical protein BGW80DRAFT_1289437 [Lactifluus volemus]
MPNWSTIGNPASQGNVLAPGVIGLLVQGIETGLVFCKLSMWCSLPEHTESLYVSAMTGFVTILGFVQTGIFFASAWRIYVKDFGQPVVLDWTSSPHILLNMLIATPIQSWLIWHSYNILKKKLYIVIPLLALLLASIIISIVATVEILLTCSGKGRIHTKAILVLTGIFPSVLDIAISVILFCYLAQAKKRVYTEQMRQYIARMTTIVWQSAIPPTLFTIGVAITLFVSQRFQPAKSEVWCPTLQAMVGKLYILSLFYNLNSRGLPVKERGSKYISTLTVPTLDVTTTINCNTREAHVEAQNFTLHLADEEERK